MDTYFDAVIMGAEMEPIVNDTPEAIVTWLKNNEIPCDCFRVVEGKTLKILTVSEYLEKNQI